MLVDDHKIFRESLSKLLVSEKIANVIGEAGNGIELLSLLESYKPDLILLDIQMPLMDGIEATGKALERYPGLKILVLSSFGDEKYYFKMLEAGAKGFVLKNSGLNELELAIGEVCRGNTWFSNELLQKVIISISKPGSKELGISEREQDVLKLICEGFTNDQIAEKLFLSTDTIKWHRNNLLSKTGCKNTASLVMYSIRSNLIEI
ncbi:MAG: response regulator transcription factor [Bacteroidales bacterium]|nr:response regulator transcription factor [Bacteroidales bacterium]